MVVVWSGRRWPFQGVSSGGGPLLQVVEPESQGGTVLQGSGGVDEGIGQELARLFQVVAMLDGVCQDAWKQAHVLTLGFHVTRFEQWEMGKDKRDDPLLGLALPLADKPYRTKRKERR